MAKTTDELVSKMESMDAARQGRELTLADQFAALTSKPAMRAQLQAAATKHLTPDRLMRLFLTNIRTTPGLANCSLESIVACLMLAAQLGLEPGPLGHCYLVPFGKEARLIIGYKGLIDLARRSGQLVTIAAFPIYSKDDFLCEYGFEQRLVHKPNFGDRGDLIGFYSYALTSDGGRFADVMSLEEVKKIKNRSRAGNNGPWVTDFEEMGRKTVLRRMCKYLPMSIEWQQHNTGDEEREFSDAASIEVVQPKALTEGGTWPAVEAPNSALNQQTVDQITQAASEKLARKRAATRGDGVSVDDVAALIPAGPGEGETTPLFDAEA